MSWWTEYASKNNSIYIQNFLKKIALFASITEGFGLCLGVNRPVHARAPDGGAQIVRPIRAN